MIVQFYGSARQNHNLLFTGLFTSEIFAPQSREFLKRNRENMFPIRVKLIFLYTQYLNKFFYEIDKRELSDRVK